MKDVKELLEYENRLLSEGKTLIAGVDEVGRGPLAGPVVTACVIMDLNNLIQGVDDSKKLSAKKREQLYDEIISHCIDYKITQVSESRIDEINILNATKESMCRSINGLQTRPQVVLVDAIKLDDVEEEQMSIIKGDAKSYSIACASILAKVFRDRLMDDYDSRYPEYGFAKHKGYGTRAHIEAIKEHGPCKIHRRTFIKNFCGDK